MKAQLYKILAIILLLPALSFCHNDLNGKHTKEKKISKDFKVSKNATLKIENSYGNIDISTWDRNEISIEVYIKTNGNDAEKVQEKLDDINVEFNQNSSGVSAKTYFSRENRSWWSSLFNSSNNVNMEINYVVRAPETNNVNLNNDYGGIFIDKLTGNAQISCDYGKIDITELWGDRNLLNFDYSRNSHFGFIKNAEINADYSDYEVEEAEILKVNADYTNSKIKKVAQLDFDCDYGSISVDKVKKLVGNGDYLSTKIGRVFTSLDLNIDYGNAKIEKIIKGAKTIKIDSDYAGIKIGYDREHAFNFNVESSYGSVKGLEGLEVQKRNQQSTKTSVSGYHLSQNNGSNIQINTSYAGVQFNRE